MADAGELVGVGRTSDVYAYGPDSVIKVPRPSVPRHWSGMEATFTAAVRELGAPAPEVRGIVEIAGHDSVVFERINGRSMWDLMVESPADAPALARELAAIHQRILSIGLPLGVPALVERMSSKLAQVESLNAEEKREAQSIVARLPRGAALLHGDLHPANILMGDRGPFVIDWFDASIGHPIADVVRSSLLLRPFGDDAQPRPHLPGAPAGLLAAIHDSYLEAMGPVIEPALDTVRDWEAVVGASRLAEDAEVEETPLLAMWRYRSAVGDDERVE